MRSFFACLCAMVLSVSSWATITVVVTIDPGFSIVKLDPNGTVTFTATVYNDNTIQYDPVTITYMGPNGLTDAKSDFGVVPISIPTAVVGTYQVTADSNGVSANPAKLVVQQLTVAPTKVLICVNETSSPLTGTLAVPTGGESGQISQASPDNGYVDIVIVPGPRLYLGGGGGPQDGKFTVIGKKAGNVTLTITEDQAPGCTAQVTIIVHELTVSPIQVDLCVDEKSEITATITPSNAGGTATVAAASDDKGTVELSKTSLNLQTGSDTFMVTARTSGTVKVTVTYDNDKQCHYTVVVRIGAIAITGLTPADSLRVGDDLIINYALKPPGFPFTAAELKIYNTNDVLVFDKKGLDASPGDHTTKWENVMWNQAPHAGAYANPNNGPYKIVLEATHDNKVCSRDNTSLNVVLELSFNIEDPAGATDIANRAGIVIGPHNLVGIFQGQEVQLTSVETAGANHTVATIESNDSQLNNLDDGRWTFEIKDFRDDIGNFTRNSGDKSFKLNLR